MYINKDQSTDTAEHKPAPIVLSISSENLETFFNPYHAAGLFLYTLKTSENDVFRGYRKRIVAWNGSKVEECLTVCFRLFAQPTTWIAKGNYTFCIIHGLCEQYNIPVDGGGGGSVNLRPQMKVRKTSKWL